MWVYAASTRDGVRFIFWSVALKLAASVGSPAQKLFFCLYAAEESRQRPGPLHSAAPIEQRWRQIAEVPRFRPELFRADFSSACRAAHDVGSGNTLIGDTPVAKEGTLRDRVHWTCKQEALRERRNEDFE
jgi:hypothetical protein